MVSLKVAVVGATGNVGRVILDLLSQSNLKIDAVVPLASSKSTGKMISYGDDTIKVRCLDDYDFYGTDIAIFSAGALVSSKYVAKAVDSGSIVIDNTSYFRNEDDVPLIIPEINDFAISDFRRRNIISSPNCSTIQMLVALYPLHQFAKIKRIVVSTYQSTSGAGKKAMDELFLQSKNLFVNGSMNPNIFTKQIAYNCIPHIDSFMEDGGTKEEWKMVCETKKILGSEVEVSATCVRVPVFVGHAESVNVEFHEPISEEDAFGILSEAPGLLLLDRRDDGGYMTQSEVACDDSVYVSRLRVDPTVPSGLNMWVVADNLRKGAALNVVQIAEILVSDYL